MKPYYPLRSTINPDCEDLQSWADANAHDFHGASVEACHLMAITNHLDNVIVVEFMWEDEVYADIVLNRSDADEALSNAEAYYVSYENYELASYVKSIRVKLNKSKNK